MRSTLFVQKNNHKTFMSILMVVKFHGKDIGFVSKYLHINNAPPSILQANTSKKVSIGCSYSTHNCFHSQERLSFISLRVTHSVLGSSRAISHARKTLDMLKFQITRRTENLFLGSVRFDFYNCSK